jgi:uncharacterized protein (TIGR02453 family)
MNTSLAFLKDLERNNNRDWFNANKNRYEASKTELAELVSLVLERAPLFEPGLAGQSPKDSIFRIYRDTRFSPNKTPYKNNIGAWLVKGGRKSPLAGYYIHIQPGNSFLAGGIWMPEVAALQLIRQELHFNHEVFRSIVNATKFKRIFKQMDDHQLKTIPKGYEKSDPAIDLLRYKSFVVSLKLEEDQLADVSALSKEIVGVFTAMSPFVQFLNNALELGKS